MERYFTSFILLSFFDVDVLTKRQCAGVKKQAQMAALTQECNRLKIVVTAYQSFLNTAKELEQELSGLFFD